ncbi:hypothetical protein TRAPUB_4918 [Trametes pubescens]|uniref:Uncharacterized protein n=1 Tax=Trametes pubescens TaxID=154538 RepID=A0A1M2VA25_TRAPU|nr:hypothetical protein TRAPUB_4918 [Trametes pubescens]
MHTRSRSVAAPTAKRQRTAETAVLVEDGGHPVDQAAVSATEMITHAAEVDPMTVGEDDAITTEHLDEDVTIGLDIVAIATGENASNGTVTPPVYEFRDGRFVATAASLSLLQAYSELAAREKSAGEGSRTPEPAGGIPADIPVLNQPVPAQTFHAAEGVPAPAPGNPVLATGLGAVAAQPGVGGHGPGLPLPQVAFAVPGPVQPLGAAGFMGGAAAQPLGAAVPNVPVHVPVVQPVGQANAAAMPTVQPVGHALAGLAVGAPAVPAPAPVIQGVQGVPAGVPPVIQGPVPLLPNGPGAMGAPAVPAPAPIIQGAQGVPAGVPPVIQGPVPLLPNVLGGMGAPAVPAPVPVPGVAGPVNPPIAANLFDDIDYVPDAIKHRILGISGQSDAASNLFSVAHVPASADWGRGRMEKFLMLNGVPVVIWLIGRVRTTWFYNFDGQPHSRVNVGITPALFTDMDAIDRLYTRARPRSAFCSLTLNQARPFEEVYDGTGTFREKTAMTRLSAADVFEDDIVVVECNFTRWRKNTEGKKKHWSTWDVGFEMISIATLFSNPNPVASNGPVPVPTAQPAFAF